MEHASWQPRSQLLRDVHPGRIGTEDTTLLTALNGLSQNSTMSDFRAASTLFSMYLISECQQRGIGAFQDPCVHCD